MKVIAFDVPHERPAQVFAPAARSGESYSVGLLPVVSLVLWVVCLSTGVFGLCLRYPKAIRPTKPVVPIQAERIEVQVARADLAKPDLETVSATAAEPTAADPAPPDPPTLPTQEQTAPEAPALMAVAKPAPAIAFAVPVERPATVNDPAKAAPASHTEMQSKPVQSPPAANPSAPQRLTFGEGEGKQPDPSYPREAVLARQEGTVVIRFTVGTDGRVTQAEVATRAPSALLNQAALRAVRDTWRFRSGPVRVYEVAIEFQLQSR